MEPVSWNPASYNVNRNAVPLEEVEKESREQGGRYVARSTDGTRTYFYADSYGEVFRLMDERGIKLNEAVVGRVPVWDEGELF